MDVRAARPEDLPACAALYDAVCREIFTWFPDEQRGDQFLREAEEEDVYVAELAGEIVGIASLYRPESFLHSLYVAKAARGVGVGSRLFDHVRQVADGPVSLKVQKLNAAAIAFYRRKGLVVTEDGEPDAPGGGWHRMAPG